MIEWWIDDSGLEPVVAVDSSVTSLRFIRFRPLRIILDIADTKTETQWRFEPQVNLYLPCESTACGF